MAFLYTNGGVVGLVKCKWQGRGIAPHEEKHGIPQKRNQKWIHKIFAFG